MKEFIIPVSGYVRVRAFVKGQVTIEARDIEEARKIAAAIEKAKTDSISLLKIPGVKEVDDFEWQDEIRQLAKEIERTEADDISLHYPDILQNIEQYEA